MSNVIEIKAMSQEQAITRALKIMEATPEQVKKVVEKQKSRSFLGLFLIKTYLSFSHNPKSFIL